MSRPLTPEEIRAVLRRAVTVTVCGVNADGRLIARPMHAAVVGDQVVIHGGTRGEKHGLTSQPVVITASEVVARLPSWFTDPVRACPASTLYRSVEVQGVLTPIEDPAAKAEALHLYSLAEQPEGRFERVSIADKPYAAQLDRLVVAGVDLSGAVGRGQLGGAKPRGWRKRIAAGLWGRGAPGDVEAIEMLRKEAPDTPLPPAYAAPTGVLLHPGQPRHISAVVAMLVDQYWNTDFSADAVHQAHLQSSAWGVAMAGDVVIGTARAISDAAKTAWIYDVAVDPAWQGQGVGRALMTWIDAHPKVRSVERVVLGTRDAMPFYAGLGFTAPPPRDTTLMWRLRGAHPTA